MEVSDRDQELDRYILKNLGDFKERRSFIKAFAKWLSNYHQLNLYHQDMKTCNMMISKAERPGISIFLTWRMSVGWKVSGKELFKNFLQLNTSTPKTVTTTDRFRFFGAYLRLNPIVKDRKSFLRRLIHESKRRELVYVAPWGVVTERL